MEEHLLSTGSFPDEMWALAWVKNPPRKPNRPLEVGDQWQEGDGESAIFHYVDKDLVERYMPLT